MDSEIIGFVGLGIMGRPMALNLIKAGYQLQVFARRPQTAEPLVAAGAKLCESPKQSAERAQMIITIVSDTPDVEAVVLGEQGIIQGVQPNAVVVDMSTISPSVTCQIATHLEAKGLEMLDAPVSGGEQGAIDGSLSIMVGGRKPYSKLYCPYSNV